MSKGLGSAQRYALHYLSAWHRARQFPSNVWVIVTQIANAWAADAPIEEAVARSVGGALGIALPDPAGPLDRALAKEEGHDPYPRASPAQRESMRRAIRVLADRDFVRVTYVNGQLSARPILPREREEWLREGARTTTRRRNRQPRSGGAVDLPE